MCLHPGRSRDSLGSLFTLEIPVNDGRFEASRFKETRFGLEVSGKPWKKDLLRLPGDPSGWTGNFSDHSPRDPSTLNRTLRPICSALESFGMFGG